MAKIFPKDWLKSKPEKEIHLMSIKELQVKFNVDIKKGLSSKKVNELQKVKKKHDKIFLKRNFINKIVSSLTDFFSILLWISIVLFALLYELFKDTCPDINNLINIVIISLILIAKVVIVSLQEYKSCTLTNSLNPKDTCQVSVLRDSMWGKISICELVVGDIVEIRSNDRVPADLRLILANNLLLDKSILTGNLALK